MKFRERQRAESPVWIIQINDLVGLWGFGPDQGLVQVGA